MQEIAQGANLVSERPFLFRTNSSQQHSSRSNMKALKSAHVTTIPMIRKSIGSKPISFIRPITVFDKPSSFSNVVIFSIIQSSPIYDNRNVSKGMS